MVRVFSQFHLSQEGSVSEAMFLCVPWGWLPSVLLWPVMPAFSFPASVLSHWISDCCACLPYCTPSDSQDQGPFTVAFHPGLLYLLVFPSPAHPCGLWSSSSAAGFHSPSSLSLFLPASGRGPSPCTSQSVVWLLQCWRRCSYSREMFLFLHLPSLDV